MHCFLCVVLIAAVCLHAERTEGAPQAAAVSSSSTEGETPAVGPSSQVLWWVPGPHAIEDVEKENEGRIGESSIELTANNVHTLRCFWCIFHYSYNLYI